MRFNRNPLKPGAMVELESEAWDCLPATPNLQRASLQSALLFGGPAIRACLEKAPIVGDRPHVFVDTKVNMLLPGFIPAIPGWHTDGIPRHGSDERQCWGKFGSLNSGRPSLKEQERLDSQSLRPRYHTIHVGNDCATQFIDEPIEMQFKNAEDPRLYREMTIKINELRELDAVKVRDARLGQWLSWDWWQIHRAQPAQYRGWRLLIRITESVDPPLDSDFIRSQTQVYVPEEFGW
jgi:hypothetical protein